MLFHILLICGFFSLSSTVDFLVLFMFDFSKPTHNLDKIFLKDFIYLFLEKGEGREKDR